MLGAMSKAEWCCQKGRCRSWERSDICGPSQWDVQGQRAPPSLLGPHPHVLLGHAPTTRQAPFRSHTGTKEGRWAEHYLPLWEGSCLVKGLLLLLQHCAPGIRPNSLNGRTMTMVWTVWVEQRSGFVKWDQRENSQRTISMNPTQRNR